MIASIMAITMNIGGIPVTVTDPAEAAALLKELKALEGNSPKAAEAPSINGTHSNTQDKDSPYVDPDVVERAYRFLTIIREYSPKDANNEKIMKALKVSSPKAVGSKSVAINKLLINMGFRKGSVYQSVKKPREPRLWIARSNIDKAIDMLKAEYTDLKKSGALQ